MHGHWLIPPTQAAACRSMSHHGCDLIYEPAGCTCRDEFLRRVLVDGRTGSQVQTGSSNRAAAASVTVTQAGRFAVYNKGFHSRLKTAQTTRVVSPARRAIMSCRRRRVALSQRNHSQVMHQTLSTVKAVHGAARVSYISLAALDTL